MEQRQNDAERLKTALYALKEGIGHGGLTFLSGALGMSPSALRKRFESATGGFDEPTMRAVVLIAESKSEKWAGYEVVRATKIGDYVIEIRDVAGELIPTWRLAD